MLKTSKTELREFNRADFGLWLLRRRQRLRITGESMLPSLCPGDEVFIDPQAYRHAAPRAGEVVTLWHPHKTDCKLVKRIKMLTATGDCWLLGDNPAASTDSRHFGAIAPSALLGRVVCRFYAAERSQDSLR